MHTGGLQVNDETELDTGAEVTLEETPIADQEISPELIQAAMMGRGVPQIREKRGFTKPPYNRTKAKAKRKAQRVARRASRGTTSSRKGQRFTINNSAAK